MHKTQSSRFIRLGGAVAVITTFAVSTPVFAASDTWNQFGGTHSWNSGANWLSGTQFPNGVGDVAYFINDITSAQTVTISPPVTVGGMLIGDANGSHSFTIGAFGNILNIDNGGSATTISNTATFNQVFANLTGTGVNRDLTVDVASGTSLNIGSTGTQSPMTIGTFTKNGSGALGLGTTGSTFTDPNVYLNAGAVNIMGSDALPITSIVRLGPTAYLSAGGGGRNQTVAEVRGTGSFRDGGNTPFIVGNPAGVTSVGTTIAASGRLRPGDLTAIGQVGTLYIGDPSGPAVAPRWESGSESYFDIAGYASFDQIDIRRTFTTIYGGDVYVNFLSGFAPTNGAQFALMVDTSTRGYLADPNGGQLFDNIYDNDGNANPFHGYFIAQRGGTFVDGEDPQGLGSSQIIFTYLIPEPSAVALLLIAGGAIVLRRRR